MAQGLIVKTKSNQQYLQKVEKLSKNPFLHNDFIYNRLLRSCIGFNERLILKPVDSIVKDKADWIEIEFFDWLCQLLKLLQKFDSKDVVPMKSEIANVFNLF